MCSSDLDDLLDRISEVDHVDLLGLAVHEDPHSLIETIRFVDVVLSVVGVGFDGKVLLAGVVDPSHHTLTPCRFPLDACRFDNHQHCSRMISFDKHHHRQKNHFDVDHHDEGSSLYHHGPYLHEAT